MKDLIVVIGLIVLGCIVFNLIINDDEGLLNTCEGKLKEAKGYYSQEL